MDRSQPPPFRAWRIDHEKLRQFRIDAGKTQEQLADITRIPLSTYRRYETGRGSYQPSRVDQQEHLQDLAKLLGLASLHELLISDEIQSSKATLVRRREVSAQQVAGSAPASLPVSNATDFFGRSTILNALFSWWHRSALESVALLGPRGAGKTSLLRQIVRLCSENTSRVAGNAIGPIPRQGLRAVLLDCEEPSIHTPGAMLHALCRALNLPGDAAVDLDHFAEGIVEHLEVPTVVLLDHVGGALRDPTVFDDRFFDGLRALVSNHAAGRLAFLVATTEFPLALARRYRRSSSFFSMLRTISLGPLDESEARALIAGSLGKLPEDEIAWMLTHSRCWPRLLRIACDHLARHQLKFSGVISDWRVDALAEMTPLLPAS